MEAMPSLNRMARRHRTVCSVFGGVSVVFIWLTCGLESVADAVSEHDDDAPAASDSDDADTTPRTPAKRSSGGQSKSATPSSAKSTPVAFGEKKVSQSPGCVFVR
jgi:hypothetical protein